MKYRIREQPSAIGVLCSGHECKARAFVTVVLPLIGVNLSACEQHYDSLRQAFVETARDHGVELVSGDA